MKNTQIVNKSGAMERLNLRKEFVILNVFEPAASVVERNILNSMLRIRKQGELKKLSPFLGIDYDLVEFDAQFDGINVLCTSEVNMSDEKIIENYHELSKIEDCFRVTKTEFRSRPVYVRLKESMEAHFLTCFIALVVLRVLQVKTNRMMSSKRLVEALQSARALELGKGYCRVQANEDMKEMNQFLGIEWNYAHVKSEKIEQYAKGWCTTQKIEQKNG